MKPKLNQTDCCHGNNDVSSNFSNIIRKRSGNSFSTTSSTTIMSTPDDEPRLLATRARRTTTILTTTAANMLQEIDAAVRFLSYLLVKAQFSAESAELFRDTLTTLLFDHYDGHWYPDDPLKGSGYRCLRVNGVMNPLLKIAAELCNIPLSKFRRAFPAELTIWIDPGDVNVRIGEEGSIGAFYAKSDGSPALELDHTFSNSASNSPSSAANGTSTPTKQQQRSSPSSRQSPVVFTSESIKTTPKTTRRATTGVAWSNNRGRQTPVSLLNSHIQIQQNASSGLKLSPIVGYRPEDHQIQVGVKTGVGTSVNNSYSPIFRSSPGSQQDPSSYKMDYQLYGNVHVGGVSRSRSGSRLSAENR